MSRILVIPGAFVPYNDTVSLLTFKHLRLNELEKDVIAIEGKCDQSILDELKCDSTYNRFHVEYVCKYDEIIASMEKKNVCQGVWNIVKYIRTCLKKFDKKEHTIIYSSSVPCFTHVAAYLIKRKHPQVKWIASFSDPIYKSPYKKDPESFKEYSLLGKIGFYVYIWIYMNGWYEKIAMRHADHIVVICDEQRDFMISNYPELKDLEKKSVIVPLNYIPEWEIYKKMMNAPQVQHQKKVFSHFGRIYGLRTIDEFLLALKELKEEIPDFEQRFVFEQYGQILDRYKKMIYKYELESCVNLHEKIPYSEVSERMIQSDCLCLFDTIMPEDQVQPYLPSKSLEYLLMKKEVLVVSTIKSPAYRIFSKLGYPCCRANVEEIKGYIRSFLDGQISVKDFDVEQFSNEVCCQPLHELMSEKRRG